MGFTFWGIPPLGVLVHLLGHFPYRLPQRFIQCHRLTAARFPVKQGPFRNGTAEHLFQTYSLGAELKFVGLMGLWLASLILHRIGHP